MNIEKQILQIEYSWNIIGIGTKIECVSLYSISVSNGHRFLFIFYFINFINNHISKSV